MHYGFSADEQELIGHFARLVSTTPQDLDPASAPDRSLWEELATAGWTDALALRTEGISEAAVVAMGEELGKACPSVPWTAAYGYVGPLLSGLDTPVAAELRARLQAGGLVTAAWRDVDVSLTPQGAGDRTLASGRLGLVPYAQDAESILVLPGIAGRRPLIAVPGTGPGIDVVEVATVDLRHRYADVTLDRAEVRVVAAPGTDLERRAGAAREQLSLMLSAEALGGLARLIDDAVAYVSERRQFGVPIGSFQAVKHHIAHAATTLANGRALTYLAASATAGADDRAGDVAAARRYTGRGFLLGAEKMIQVHGGFGFTWEAGRHIWYRNAMVNVQLDPSRDGTPADLTLA